MRKVTTFQHYFQKYESVIIFDPITEIDKKLKANLTGLSSQQRLFNIPKKRVNTEKFPRDRHHPRHSGNYKALYIYIKKKNPPLHYSYRLLIHFVLLF